MAGFHDDPVISGTYDVVVTRAGSPSGTPTPIVSVYGLSDAKEGYTMPFILARTGDTSQSLAVTVTCVGNRRRRGASSLRGKFRGRVSGRKRIDQD